jgi:MYXO-CTERM domain-containing protein
MKGTMAVLAAIALAAGTAHAGVIFNNGGPDNQGYFPSDFDVVPIARTADDFTLAQAATIRDVHWWGLYQFSGALPATDDFTIEIYATVAGVPANVAPMHSLVVGDVGRTATGGFLPGDGPNVYKYDVGGLNIPLAAGTYMLCIINDTPGSTRDWQWARGLASGTMWTKTGIGDWEQFASPSRVAFNLTDDITASAAAPEPAGLGLIGVAMLMFGRRRS